MKRLKSKLICLLAILSASVCLAQPGTFTPGGGGGGGGNCTVAGATNAVQKNSGASNCAASSIIDNGTTVTTTEPIQATSFTGSDVAHSAALTLNGVISGTVALAAADIAGTSIAYVLPSTNGTAGQFLVDSGSTTCPTLVAGAPATCHLMTWTTLAATLLPATPVPTPGTTITLSAPRGYAVCTGTCTVTLPVPAAGYEFCAENNVAVSTAITMAALGSSARYGNTAQSAYGTAGTGTFTATAAAANKVCFIGVDATHYNVQAFVGTWTAN